MDEEIRIVGIVENMFLNTLIVVIVPETEVFSGRN